jgi:hypothetical protein
MLLQASEQLATEQARALDQMLLIVRLQGGNA